MIKAVLVDMDNTLIETQILYTNAEKYFASYVSGFGSFDTEEILDYFHKRQIDLFATMGYKAAMLPQAYEDTLKHFVSDATAKEIAFARDISRQVFEQEAALKHGVEAAIAELSKHYPIYLVTVGDLDVQQSRVDVLPFKDTFSGVFIVEHKESATYRDVLRQIGVKPEEAVMIGDSLKSDIIPAVQNGMSAIYIPAENWAARELSGSELPEKGVTTHTCLSDAAMSLIALKTPGRGNKPPTPPAM